MQILGLIIPALFTQKLSFADQTLPRTLTALPQGFCEDAKGQGTFSYRIETDSGVTQYIQEKQVKFLGAASGSHIKDLIKASREQELKAMEAKTDAAQTESAKEDAGGTPVAQKSSLESAKQYLRRLLGPKKPPTPPAVYPELKDDPQNPIVGALKDVIRQGRIYPVRRKACENFVQAFEKKFLSAYWVPLAIPLSPAEKRIVCNKRVNLIVAGMSLPQFCIAYSDKNQDPPRMRGLRSFVTLLDSLFDSY